MARLRPASRRCTRTGCACPAVRTLTYIYSDSTVVLGPLSTYAEPHSYDLCADHGARLTAPRGWELIRLSNEEIEPGPSDDDLLAIAEAVRSVISSAPASAQPTIGRRGHLRALPSE
jgi:hypothetical protein